MTTLTFDLEARREEFDSHFSLSVALENQMMLDASFGDVSLSARHINTIKSGLIIHLYNIEEALLSKALDMLGGAIGASDPRKWTEHSFKEWLREAVVSRTMEGDENGRLETVFDSSRLLMSTSLGPQKLKKPSGTWDDKLIAIFLRRMNISFTMPPEMWARIAATPAYGDKTPMQFLALKRNAIAHGRRTFEDGASELGLSEIRQLADITLDYLKYAAAAFEQHIADEAHLVPAT
jgi:hypothetical protein